MRNRFALLVLLVALAFVLTSAAVAETKVSGEIQCKSEPPATAPIPDKPNHAFAIVKATCTWTKPFDLGGSAVKDGSETISSEMSGDKGTDHGYFAGTTAGGDTYTVRFDGTSHSKDGKPAGNEGTWSFSGGTGKLKGIKGGGKYTSGPPAPDGALTTRVDGEYSLP
jgi:hypothetical protein